MQETASLERAFELSAIATGEKSRAMRTRVYTLLEERGFSPAPTLVSDLLTVALDGTCIGSSNRDQPARSHVVRCMGEVSQAMTKAYGSRVGRDELFYEVALRFLQTWLAGAPKHHASAQNRPRLEIEAIGSHAIEPRSRDDWTDWRISEEASFREGGSPSFRRALAEVRTSSERNFGEVDERIWFMSGDGGGPPRDLNITSVRRAGGEGVPVRSLLGVFSEVSPHGVPPDPSRITPSDLALFSAKHGPMRALLASKLADSALMVRFGSMPTPARQRPRVLLVAGLFDTIAMHIQRKGQVIPDIEVLRESLLHAVVSCVHTFSGAQVDFELELRRDGPIARGSVLFNDMRTIRGHLKLEYRKSAQLRDRLAQRAPWIFADTPSLNHRGRLALPQISNYDAAYLIAAGARSQVHGCDWTGAATVEPDGSDQCMVTASGSVARPTTLLSMADAKALGLGLSACFGEEPDRLERGGQQPSNTESAVIT